MSPRPSEACLGDDYEGDHIYSHTVTEPDAERPHFCCDDVPGFGRINTTLRNYRGAER